MRVIVSSESIPTIDPLQAFGQAALTASHFDAVIALRATTRNVMHDTQEQTCNLVRTQICTARRAHKQPPAPTIVEKSSCR